MSAPDRARFWNVQKFRFAKTASGQFQYPPLYDRPAALRHLFSGADHLQGAIDDLVRIGPLYAADIEQLQALADDLHGLTWAIAMELCGRGGYSQTLLTLNHPDQRSISFFSPVERVKSA